MFLSKLFKRKSTKLLTLFGALAMALGVGATASVVASEQQNEVMETKAETDSNNAKYLRMVFSGTSWVDSNAVTCIWGDNTYMNNNWGTIDSGFGAASYKGSSGNGYNTISVNGSGTYYYNDVYVSNGTLSNISGQTLYMKRLNPGNTGQTWNEISASFNSSSANGFLIQQSGSSWTATAKKYYKIRLQCQTSLGGSWVNYGTYLRESGSYTLPKPDKSYCPPHYKFDGWYTSSSLTGSPVTSFNPGADTTLYAKYSIGLYLIGNGVGSATGWTVASAVLGTLSTNTVDHAYWEGISISKDAEFRLAQIADGANTNYYEPSGAGSAYNASTGDIRGGGASNFKCYVAGTYDIYYSKDGKLYFINEASKITLGYLYMPYTSSGNTTLNIVTYKVAGGSSAGDECISGTSLWTSVPSAVSYTSIRFSGHYGSTKTGLARIPIYDLRGLNSNAALSFKISLDGGTSWSSVVNLPGTTDTPHVYWEYGWGGVSGTMGVAARALFEIGSAIETATTLCALSPEEATPLKALYDAVTDGLDSYADFRASNIYTYKPEGNSYSGGDVKIKTKVDVPITDIYAQLSSRSSTGNWLVLVVPGAHRTADSPLTTTLWIVLASGLAGLAAIGTAYFVSKKKRHQA